MVNFYIFSKQKYNLSSSEHLIWMMRSTSLMQKLPFAFHLDITKAILELINTEHLPLINK